MSLRPLVSELAMRLTVHPLGSDELYPEGTPISMRLDRTRRGGAALHATVFNLAADGTVQLIYPLDADGAGLIDAATRQSMLDTVVVPPFGVDHVIALATPEAPEALRAALRNADGQRASAGLAGIIRTELKRARGRGSLSIAELYTAR
jgi:hypothetical protein